MTGTPPLVPRPLRATGLHVTPLCFGAASLGSMPETFGYAVPRDRAIATVRRALSGPVNFVDTAAGYTDGESERRIGAVLREIGGRPDGFVIATKVDRDGKTGDFSGDQVRRSAEGSLERLGLESFQLLYLHDPEHLSFEEGVAAGGPLEALVRLRDEGLAQHIGVAGGPVALMTQYVRTEAFQVVLTHNRWTLVDRSAGALIDEAVALGLAVVNAAPFGGGLLARGADSTSRYAYHDAPPEVLDRVRSMEDICAAHGVPLPAAALQFSMRDPRIDSTVVGVTRPERVDETVRLASWPIPDDVWAALQEVAAPTHFWQW